jgi:hypothetical protein
MEKIAGCSSKPDVSAFSPLHRYKQALGLLSLTLEKVHARQTSAGTRECSNPTLNSSFWFGSICSTTSPKPFR